MRVVIQRVNHAKVTIEEKVKATIGKGYVVLLGICNEDTTEDADWLVKKIINLRIFDDDQGVMNLNILAVDGNIIVVSQFTLYAEYKKGNRPSWIRAANHEIAIPLYEYFCKKLSEKLGKPIETGEFGAYMKVDLENDGPVTICMDTQTKR